MTTAALEVSYDSALDPSRSTLTNLSGTGYCVSTGQGGRSLKKNGPGAIVSPGTAPSLLSPHPPGTGS
jgi:hypothetical protein